jgi:hypothetical protein
MPMRWECFGLTVAMPLGGLEYPLRPRVVDVGWAGSAGCVPQVLAIAQIARDASISHARPGHGG